MGVRLLARTTVAPLAQMEARLAALGGRPTGRWRTACTYMLPRASDSKLHELFDVQPEGGGERYLVSRGAEGEVRVLRAGASISAILAATNTHTARIKVLLDGGVHGCGDFVVRLGQFFHNGTLAGVCVEVEYLPCALATAAAAAPLQALLDRLLPEAERDYCSAQSECFADAHDLPALVGPEHSALLLVGLLRARILSSSVSTV